jgi:hypothetical protein
VEQLAVCFSKLLDQDAESLQVRIATSPGLRSGWPGPRHHRRKRQGIRVWRG